MGKVLILQNAPLFTGGNFEEELTQRNIPFEVKKAYEGEKLPIGEQLAAYSGLIVLGGPLSLRVEEPSKVSWLAKEFSLLRQALDQHLPIIAVGQGANLLASAQGAWIDRSPKLKEIGWVTGEVYADYSRNSVIYSTIDEKFFPIFCWYDTINGFPPTGYWYMLSPNCRYQSTGIHGNCYLFNFHPEVNEALLNSWLKEYGKEVGSKEAIQKIQEQGAEGFQFAKKLSQKIIHAFEAFLKSRG